MKLFLLLFFVAQVAFATPKFSMIFLNDAQKAQVEKIAPACVKGTKVQWNSETPIWLPITWVLISEHPQHNGLYLIESRQYIAGQFQVIARCP